MQGSEGLPPGTGPVKSGDVLAGKYRVDRVLGVGGMGIVVAATHLQLDRPVALKFMLPEALAHAALVERFAREARAAVRLKSDHVARVLDVGTLESGSPFMVMEYLEGSDLGSVIESGGALPIETAVDFVLQACDAIAEAHSIGIVHRDLKPRNLFLTRRNDGRPLVKVLDFGIAKQKSAGDLSLTKTADIMGSPNYMSPEQLRASRAADERSDIWAIGVILYELLSGLLPFAAESMTQLVAMLLTENPRPIRTVRSDVPSALATAVERCLEKDPAARFASVAELAVALEPFAPVEGRDLVKRIARISSGSAPSATPLVSGEAAAPMPSGTNASWWSKTDMAVRTSRGRWVAVAVAVPTLGLAGVVAVVAAMRVVRPAAHDPMTWGAAKGAAIAPENAPVEGRGAPQQTITPPSTTSVSAAVGATRPAMVETSMPEAKAALLPTPAADATRLTDAREPERSAPISDAGALRMVRPHRDVPAPTASVGAPASEAPHYRTSW